MYTGWNMTCSPRANRLYTARERAAGRQQGRGKVARLARIQKSKNSGSWCAKAFYCTKYKYLVKNGGTSGKFWKGYFEKPGPQKTWLRNSLRVYIFSLSLAPLLIIDFRMTIFLSLVFVFFHSAGNTLLTARKKKHHSTSSPPSPHFLRYNKHRNIVSRRVDPSALAFSLSSHRYSYIGLLFSSRFFV